MNCNIHNPVAEYLQSGDSKARIRWPSTSICIPWKKNQETRWSEKQNAGKGSYSSTITTQKKKRVLSTAVSTWLLVIISVCMCHCSFLPQWSIQMYLPGDSRLMAVTWLRCSPHPPWIFAVFLSFVITYGGDGPLPYIQLVASNSSNSVYVKRDFSSKLCKGLQARNPNVVFGFMTVWFLIIK